MSNRWRAARSRIPPESKPIYGGNKMELSPFNELTSTLKHASYQSDAIGGGLTYSQVFQLKITSSTHRCSSSKLSHPLTCRCSSSKLPHLLTGVPAQSYIITGIVVVFESGSVRSVLETP
jgi:hypothetical protein